MSSAVVVVLERLAQQEHGALDRRQALQQDEEGHRDRVRRLGLLGDAGSFGHQRLGKPRARVVLALRLRRPHEIDGEPRHHRRQQRPRLAHRRAIEPSVADERFLHEILRLRDAAAHPVGDGEEPAAFGAEEIAQVLVVVHPLSRRATRATAAGTR
jgi:hypothetical protein